MAEAWSCEGRTSGASLESGLSLRWLVSEGSSGKDPLRYVFQSYGEGRGRQRLSRVKVIYRLWTLPGDGRPGLLIEDRGSPWLVNIGLGGLWDTDSRCSGATLNNQGWSLCEHVSQIFDFFF